MRLDWSTIACLAIVITVAFELGRHLGASSERRRLRRKFHEHSVAARRPPLSIQDLPDLNRFEDQSRSADKRRHE